MLPLEKKQTLSDKEYRAYYEKYGNAFKVGMGAEAIQTLLKEVDLDKEIEDLRKELDGATGQKRIRLVKRLDCLVAFKDSGNRPEWMILDSPSSYSTRFTSNDSIRWWAFCY